MERSCCATIGQVPRAFYLTFLGSKFAIIAFSNHLFLLLPQVLIGALVVPVLSLVVLQSCRGSQTQAVIAL